MSEERPQSLPNISLIFCTLFRYHSRVVSTIHQVQNPCISTLHRKVNVLADVLVCSPWSYNTSSVISFGCEVENRIRRSGLTWLLFPAGSAKFTTLLTPFFSIQALLFFSSLHLYESTFCPRSVTSRYPLSNRAPVLQQRLNGITASFTSPGKRNDTKGAHIVASPHDRNKCSYSIGVQSDGLISAYVSSRDKNVLTAFAPSSTWSISLGRSR